MATLRERVMERYPSLMFMLSQPELKRLISSALDENWSPGSFQSRLMATKWFRSQSESERRWWVTAATDPAEARQQVSGFRYGVRDYATSLGVNLTPAQTLYMATAMAKQGITDPRDPRIRNAILASPQANKKGWGGPGIGAIHTAEREIGAMLQSDFLRTPSASGARHWAKQVATGQRTIEDFRAAEMVNAVKRFPHMADLITQGLTPGEIIAENRAIIAQELEMQPEQIDVMKNAHWRQLTGVKDAKTNKMRLPTFNEVIRMARSQPQWWKTTNGRQTDAGLAQGFLALMGRRPTLNLG